MEAVVCNIKGEEVEKIELPADVFGVRPSPEFLHEVVTAHLNNQRRWTSNTKTRSEVSGGGHKPWKQKHTGRARAGSNRSPLWRKGGITFGPRYIDPEFCRAEMPRRKSRAALIQALSARAAQGSLKVVSDLSLDGAKTKHVGEFIKSLGAPKKPLVVLDQSDKQLALASRNIPGLKVMLASHLNAYEVLRCGQLIFTKAAMEKMRSR